MLIDQINRSLERAETHLLNPVGYIPVASTITGSFRGVLAVVEIVVGLAALLLGVPALVWSDSSNPCELGMKYACHGFANLARTSIEVVPFISLTLLAYDGMCDVDDYHSRRFRYEVQDITNQRQSAPATNQQPAAARQQPAAANQPQPEPALPYQGGLKFYQPTDSILEQADHPLFTREYVDALLQNPRHPDFQMLNGPDINRFVSFLRNLMNSNQISDHYHNQLSVENTTKIRKAILAILNTFNLQRASRDFTNKYRVTVSQILEITNNCTNRYNTGIDYLFNSVVSGEDNLEKQVLKALQELRFKIFRKAIHAVIAQDARRQYYFEHEASTFNYYSARLSGALGLPPSLSSLDNRFQAYALKEKDAEIMQAFTQEYTATRAFKEIRETINNPFDPAISSQLFTTWVQEKYPDTAYEQMDENGHFKRETVAQFLVQHQILVPTPAPAQNS